MGYLFRVDPYFLGKCAGAVTLGLLFAAAGRRLARWPLALALAPRTAVELWAVATLAIGGHALDVALGGDGTELSAQALAGLGWLVVLRLKRG